MRHERIKSVDTTSFTLRGTKGEVIPLWKPNLLTVWLRTSRRVNLVTGRYVKRLVRHNTITNVGHAIANGLMSNQGSYGFATYLAIGIGTETGSTATALNSEITTNGGARANGTASQVTTTVTNDTTSLTHTWTFTGSFAITEEGILTAASSGSLLAYQTFSAINVVSGNTLQVTHTYQT